MPCMYIYYHCTWPWLRHTAAPLASGRREPVLSLFLVLRLLLVSVRCMENVSILWLERAALIINSVNPVFDVCGHPVLHLSLSLFCLTGSCRNRSGSHASRLPGNVRICADLFVCVRDQLIFFLSDKTDRTLETFDKFLSLVMHLTIIPNTDKSAGLAFFFFNS